LGREHTVVSGGTALPGYLPLVGRAGAVVRHAPALAERGREVLAHLESGFATLPGVLGLPKPELEALVVTDDDWHEAPRDSSRPYPRGLPYFTRASNPPALVIPAALSGAITPRTPATLPLVVNHELAHAFLAGDMPSRIPAWLRELPPQTASAIVARHEGVPLDAHLAEMGSPPFTIRSFRTPASAEDQMSFQNLLLRLGAAALEEFGEGFTRRLIFSLRHEEEADGARAEALLEGALGEGGREWLRAREEF
jgi:hypothetical protein